MPFWQDCIGCSGDCVGQAVSGTPAFWLFGTEAGGGFVDVDGNPVDPSTLGVDIVDGDTLIVIGSPVLWYTTDGSAPLNGCGLFGPKGCGTLGSTNFVYDVIAGTAADVPPNPMSSEGGIQEEFSHNGTPVGVSNWQFQAGGTGMSITWSDGGISDVASAVFGTDDAIDNGVCYVPMQNQRTGVIYGWLGTITCFCF